MLALFTLVLPCRGWFPLFKWLWSLATDDERPLSAGAELCVWIPMAVLADYLKSSYLIISIN
jgi:hypothetical protein